MNKKKILKKIKYTLRFLPDKMYLQIYYFAQFKKFINFKNPKTYNEKLNWLKINDRNPEYTKMVDKYEAKEYATSIIGHEYIIPTLGVWDKFDDIDFDKLPNQFVLKCTHDSEGIVIVKDKSKLNIEEAKNKIEAAMKYNFYYIGREYPYKNIKPRIIAEKYMEDETYHELRDYKFFCFDGEPKAMFIATDRDKGETKFDYYDLNFNHLDIVQHYPNSKEIIDKPKNFDRMIELSKKLSSNLKHVRVDFYEVNGKLYFGELTFYHFSGLQPFDDIKWDLEFGSWLDLNKKEKINLLIVPTGGILRDGIVLSILDYIKHIDKEKFDITILSTTNRNEEMEKEFSNNGCKVINMPNRKKKVFHYLKKLNQLMCDNSYDIIHVHGSSSLMAMELLSAKRRNIPVRIAHSRNTKSDHKLLDKILYPLFKNSYNASFACGMDAGKFLFRGNNFEVIHNGKDLLKFKFDDKIRSRIRKEFNVGDKIAFGHVGTFNEQKNHIFLIDIFNDYHKKNENSVLFLMGLGSSASNVSKQQEIKKIVHEYHLDDSVVFLGNVSNVHEIIQGMDIMLLPSLFEGLPNVVLEWQAAGLPCLISDTITDECKVCDLVEFLSIANGTSCWISTIDNILEKASNREQQSALGCDSLVENGFEIISNTLNLEDEYSKLLSKNEK